MDHPQWMEFLAVRLHEADFRDDRGHGIVATPLYVAHADPESEG